MGLHFLCFFGFSFFLRFPLQDLCQCRAVHSELSLGAPHLKPPPVEILHHVSVTEHGPVPGAVFSLASVSANQWVALPYTLPGLGLDLPVRADLDQLGPNLLRDGPVT